MINGHASLRDSDTFVEVLDGKTVEELVEAVDSLPMRKRRTT
jgi:hypothetical protein